MMKKKLILIGIAAVIILLGALVLSGKADFSMDFSAGGASFRISGGTDKTSSETTESGSKASYQSISMDEAKDAFASEGDYIILDVRRADEFAEGHIPGAINVANEVIGTEKPAELPDLDEKIYVYCRSGRRSKEAAEKLAQIGYTGVIECGGILEWTGEIEKD